MKTVASSKPVFFFSAVVRPI